MQISIVIPCWNESARIAKSLEAVTGFVANHEFGKNIVEVIVVDDGSSDDTSTIARSFVGVKTLRYETNKGKGYALRYGVKHAIGDWIYICDADLSTPIGVLEEFSKYIGRYNCIIGSRATKGAKEKASFFRILIGKIGNFLIKILLDLDINDTQCGFKLFDKKTAEIFLQTEIDRWGYDFEFLYLTNQKGLKIHELSVKWVAVEGSKFTFRGYLSTLYEMYWVWKKYVGLTPKFLSTVLCRTAQFWRYLTVGVVTNGLNVLFFDLWYEYVAERSVELFAGIEVKNYQIFDTFNYLVTVVFLNYFLHKRWTFNSNKFSHGEMFRYSIMLVVNHFAALAILTFGIEVLGLHHVMSKIFSIVCVISWNFLLLKFFVFRK